MATPERRAGRPRAATRGRLLLVAGLLAAAAAVYLALPNRAPTDPGRRTPIDLSGIGRLLLRPLDRGPDERFRGRIPRLLALPSGPAAPAAATRAAEEIRRLYEALADPSDVAAFLDAQERLLWIGMGGGIPGVPAALLEVVPDHPRALALAAALRYEMGLRDQILPFAEAALRGNPNEVLALVYRGVRRADEGDLEGALADLRRAAAVAPSRPEPAHFLGVVLFGRGRYEEAAQALPTILPHETDLGTRVPFLRLALAYRDLLAGREPFALPQAFEPIEVEIDRGSGLPAVAVRVNRRREGRMVLDTGSQMVRLANREKSLAALREDAAVETGGADSTNPVQIPGRVESIEIAGIEVRNVPVLVEMEEHGAPDPGVLGSLGLDFLSRFDPTFDFLEDRLRLAPAGSGGGFGFSGEIRGGTLVMNAIRFLRVGNSIHVRARIGDGPEGTFLLDTGSSEITLDREILRQHFGVDDRHPRAIPVTARGVAGRPFSTFRYALPVPLVFGGMPVHGLSVLAEDFSSARSLGRTDLVGNLGLPLLSAMSFSIDFETQEISYALQGVPAGGR